MNVNREFNCFIRKGWSNSGALGGNLLLINVKAQNGNLRGMVPSGSEWDI